ARDECPSIAREIGANGEGMPDRIDITIPINEGGAIDAILRSGVTEIEIIANMRREGDTLILEGLHLAKNLGEHLTLSQLTDFAKAFARHQGVKEIRVLGAKRTTGRTSGRIPKPFIIEVE